MFCTRRLMYTTPNSVIICVFFIYTCHEHFHVLKLFEKVSGFLKLYMYLFCNLILFPKRVLKDSDTFTESIQISLILKNLPPTFCIVEKNELLKNMVFFFTCFFLRKNISLFFQRSFIILTVKSCCLLHCLLTIIKATL